MRHEPGQDRGPDRWPGRGAPAPVPPESRGRAGPQHAERRRRADGARPDTGPPAGGRAHRDRAARLPRAPGPGAQGRSPGGPPAPPRGDHRPRPRGGARLPSRGPRRPATVARLPDGVRAASARGAAGTHPGTPGDGRRRRATSVSPLPTEMESHWWQRPGRAPGRELYHWHMLFHDQPEVRNLAAQAQERLQGLPGLDMVPARWLHLTTYVVGFVDELPASGVEAMVAEARRLLAAVA